MTMYTKPIIGHEQNIADTLNSDPIEDQEQYPTELTDSFKAAGEEGWHVGTQYYRTVFGKKYDKQYYTVNDLGEYEAHEIEANKDLKMLSSTEANERYSIDGFLKFDKEISEEEAQEVHATKSKQLERQTLLSRAPTSWVGTPTRGLISMATGIVDPVNIALMAVPGVGQEAMAMRMFAGRMASGFGERFMARTAAGAVEGVVGSAAYEPVAHALAKANYEERTIDDSFVSIGFGAGLSIGARHLFAGVGAVRGASEGRVAAEPGAIEVAEMPPVGSALHRVAETDADIRSQIAETAVSQATAGQQIDLAAMDPILRRHDRETRLDAAERYGRLAIHAQEGLEPQRFDVAPQSVGRALQEAGIAYNAGAPIERHFTFDGVQRAMGAEQTGGLPLTVEEMRLIPEAAANGAVVSVGKVKGTDLAAVHTQYDLPEGRSVNVIETVRREGGKTYLDLHDAWIGIEGLEPGRSPVEAVSKEKRSAVAITPSGRRVGVRYEVADLKNLVASHGDDLELNANFPQELQPRDRTRAASASQVAQIAARLEPELLGQSATAADGAPIVGPDGVVESGNGRVMAIRRAYSEGMDSASRYKAWLQDQGYNIDGLESPVLVRRRTEDLSPEDRIAFTHEANMRSTLATGAAERAGSDVLALTPEVMSHWKSGALDSAGNRDFVRAFLKGLPESERGAMVTKEGHLSQDGIRRLEGALMAKAYGDDKLVARLFEGTDDDAKSIGNALLDAAPAWSKMRDQAKMGSISAASDPTGSLLKAVNVVRQARETGIKLKDLIEQQDMFSKQDHVMEGFVKVFYGEKLSRQVGREKIAGALEKYATLASDNTTGARLFGEALAPEEMLATVRGVKYERPAVATPKDNVVPLFKKGGDDAADFAAALQREPESDLISFAEEARLQKDIAALTDKDPEISEIIRDAEADILMYEAMANSADEAGLLPAQEKAALQAANDGVKLAEEQAGGFEAAAACMARKRA